MTARPYHRWLLLHSWLLIAVLAVAALPACQYLERQPTAAELIEVGYITVREVNLQTTRRLEEGYIKPQQARSVRAVTGEALTLLSAADDALAAGDSGEAGRSVAIAIALLTALEKEL